MSRFLKCFKLKRLSILVRQENAVFKNNLCCVTVPHNFYLLNFSKLFSNDVKNVQNFETHKGVKSTTTEKVGEFQKEVKLSYKLQLKQAVKDYGITVVIFHVAMSLTSLSICYLAVSNGLDVPRMLLAVGFSESVISNTIVSGGGTMVVSYAVHKLFAPVRIFITLTSVPFIVRYLRKVGILKLKPKRKE